MRALALIPIVFGALTAPLQPAAPSLQPPEIRLKPGDVVAVTSPYGGEFKLMPDGAIYGRGFGKLSLKGLTWDQAQAAMRKALKKFVREDDVYLTLKDLRRDVVYMVGLAGGRGPVELTPNLTLRQFLASAAFDANSDQVQVQLYRGGLKKAEFVASKILEGDPAVPDIPLEPDDVVALTPAAFVRVWLTGLVAKPGQLKVPAGTDVYRAIAESGGLRSPELVSDTFLQQEGTILVRRGPESFTFPLREDPRAKPFSLEPGDTISVIAPEERRITVSGQVQKPGEIVMRADHSLAAAIALAGGPDAEGTLKSVLVFRKGEVYSLDATVPRNDDLNADTKPGGSPVTGMMFSLDSGDLIFVQRNERTFLVLGDVNKPGKVTMKDDRAYRLSDALAEAGGLSGRGTLRRVSLGRPDSTGKLKVRQYNLDEFFKEGRIESNPELQPGDSILFGEPKGITLGTVSQVISGALLIDALGGGRR